ncbi:averantin oxidoreductase [Moelleriella libera RCEF 2490]|uniref:Averantin oxidoreductase n=1 Tax=Moelleriella libera RCEF 2490 TaxID=1081109 RepID=A0A166V8B4_9HYPO|nr:averantin oxidoreductase [Moelleriella libera RCEF 2490]
MDETLAFAFGVALHLLVFRSGEWNLYTPHLLIGSVMVNGAAIFALARLTPGTSLLASSRAVSAAFAAVLAGIYISILVYRALFHRLNRFPGPLPARISNAYVTTLKMKKMHLYDDVRQLHKKYGDVKMMADNHVSMSPSALRDYESRVQEYTRQLLDRLAESCGQPIDMAMWFNFYSFDVMGDLAFGKRLNMLRDGVVHYYMEAVHGSQVFIAAYSHLIWLTPLLKAIPVLNNCRRLQRTASRPDVFSWILADFEAQGHETPQDRLDLRGDAHLIVVAGSLACLFFELARTPQVQEQLHAEISQHHAQMSGKPGEAVSDAVLSQLRYLGACINETLRLYPPVPSGVQRMTPPEGLRLPNTLVSSLFWKDERCFEQPDEFIPERWTSKPGLVLDASVYAPFGFGRYACAGKQLALMEIRLLVSQIMHRYTVSLAPDQTENAFLDGLKDTFTLTPPSLQLVFEPRGGPGRAA